MSVSETPTYRVAAEIRAEMARRNVTQRALSEATGMHVAALGARLKGRRPITVDELTTIAIALDVEPADLMVSAAGAAV